MKNLHLIPTNKPSKLYKVNNNLYFEEYPNKTVNAGNQHIYITSDEEIKEGWSYDRMMKSIGKRNNVYSSKIILTTDLELQKDGVQAIDDEFLEWFVKNPSCEEVEVVDNLKYFNVDELRERHLKGLPHLYSEKIGYKIIIPKEEPKQEWTPTQGEQVWIKVFSNWSSGTYIGYDTTKHIHLVRENEEGGGNLLSSSKILPYKSMPNEPKKTLEEAAERISKEHYVDQSDYWAIGVDSFKRGAKWQAERMYSEEEVLELCKKSRDEGYDENTLERIGANEKIVPFGDWFEQLKKKV